MQQRTQPEKLRCRELAVSFTVSDLEQSVAWYRDVLGLHLQEAVEENGELAGAIFVAGQLKIFLSQDDFQKGHVRVKGQGFRLWLATAQDIDALAQGIQDRGGELSSGPQDQEWGARDFTFVDPDGYHVTVTTLLR
ncbi:MAG: VOC family protein [Acidobacteriota bacterium]